MFYCTQIPRMLFKQKINYIFNRDIFCKVSKNLAEIYYSTDLVWNFNLKLIDTNFVLKRHTGITPMLEFENHFIFKFTLIII